MISRDNQVGYERIRQVARSAKSNQISRRDPPGKDLVRVLTFPWWPTGLRTGLSHLSSSFHRIFGLFSPYCERSRGVSHLW